MKAHIRTHQMCFLTGILGVGLLSFGAGPYGSGADTVTRSDPAVARLPGGAPVSSGEIRAEEGGVWEAYAGMVAAATAACFPSNIPEPETLPLLGDPINQKIRYLSFSAGDPGRLQAVRVTFVNLPAPYDTWNGVIMWVDQPTTYCENSGKKMPPCPEQQPATDFLGAELGCAPWWGDFHSLGVIHVFHEGIVPGTTYVVQVVDSTCDPGQESDYSDPLLITTSRWGDLVRNCATCPCTPPDGVVNVSTDVTAVLDKFRNLGPPGVACPPVSKTRADHDWETPNQLIDISDATCCLDAFRGVGYPPPSFTPGPPPCDGPTFVCGNDVLEPGEQCDDGNRIPGDGCDENCMSELCGNGAIDGGEECDDGPDNSDTEPDACRTDCTLPRCGDDVVDSGEQCDDGSTTPGDGCDENCQIEPFVGDSVISLVPVSSSDTGATIVEEENKIELSSGGHQVFLNIRVSDWDPGASRVQLKSWQAVIDSTGYTSGLQGTLTPYAPACVDDDDCEALMGPLGYPWGAGGGCGVTGWPAGECIPAWIDNERTDYILYGQAESAAVDVSTLDFRYGSTTSAFPSPGIAELYAGTLAVDVPVDAAGTFVIDFRRGAGDTCLIDGDNYLIPLGGIEPAVITVPTACCLPDGSCDPAMSVEDCLSAGGAIVTECAGDNDGNGIDDACESAECCLSDGSCMELSLAECDAQGGTIVCACLGDVDPINGIDDACEPCAAASTPLAEDGGYGTCSVDGDCPGLSVCRNSVCYVPKNRYISFDPNNGSRCVAVQVELTAHKRCSISGDGYTCETGTDCPDPPSGQTCVDTDCVGTTWWVDAPVEVEHAGQIYWISRLTDSPVYRNWTEGVIHVGDVQIVPVAEYAIRAIEQPCDRQFPANFSAPLTLPTVPKPVDCEDPDGCYWVDMVGELQPPGFYPPPDGILDIEDIWAMIDGFMEWPEAAPPTWTDLMPEVPDMNITGREFLALRRARLGYPYPGSSPCARQSVQQAPGETEQAEATITCIIVDEAGEPLNLATTGVYMIAPSNSATLEVFVKDAPEGVTMYQTCVDFKREPREIEPDQPYSCRPDTKRSSGRLSLGPECDEGQIDPDVTIDPTHGDPRDWLFDGLFSVDANFNCPYLFVTAGQVPGSGSVPIEPPAYLSEYTFAVPQEAGGNVYEIYFVREQYTISADFSELLPRDADGNTTAMSIIVEDPCVKLLVVFDCNENQIPDTCDIDCGSQACLDTGWTGECGGSADCNGNSIPDECEISVESPASPPPPFEQFFCKELCVGCPVIVTPAPCTCVNTGEECPDGCDCENPEGCLTACDPKAGCDPQCSDAILSCDPDCNDNGVPDACDITSAAGNPNLSDCNENCVPDKCDILGGLDGDSGLCEGEGGVDCSWDCQPNQIPDECEADCSNDGCPDDCEYLTEIERPGQSCGQPVAEEDCDSDGICNVDEISEDDGGNCVGEDCSSDCQLEGKPGHKVPDECDINPSDPDGDGWISSDCQPNQIPDECDITCADNPECTDDCMGNLCCKDCDNDLIPDGCNIRDCDGDVACEDCNFNGVPDACGIHVNQGGLCDEDDPADCESCDANANGMPDECECPGASPTGACDNAFDGPAAPTTTIDAAFRIEWLNGNLEEFSSLSGSATIERGTPHFHDDDPADTGDDQPCLVPPGFPEPHPTDFARSREVHLEITSLQVGSCPGGPCVRHRAAEESIGETQGACLDFPADTFFTWYIQATMGTRELHNETPIVLRGELPDFGWTFSNPRSVFANDHTGPAIPLFEDNGVQRAYLATTRLGQGQFTEGTGESCRVYRGVDGRVSFAVDGQTQGVLIPNCVTNHVKEDKDAVSPRQRVTVYNAMGDPPPPADFTGTWENSNAMVPALTGDMEAVDDPFRLGDAINSMSFGRDGTGDVASPILYFSVDVDSTGRECTDVSRQVLAHQDDRQRVAADVYMAAGKAFGSYDSPLVPPCTTEHGNCLVADQTALGLGPLVKGKDLVGQENRGLNDNIIALETSTFPGDWAYFTFKGVDDPLDKTKTTIYVYNPANGSFRRGALDPFVNLGPTEDGGLGILKSGDTVDAIAVSDVGGSRQGPNGQWDDGDEVLFSLDSESQTLEYNGWSGAHIFKVTFGDSGPINVFLGPAALGLNGGTDDPDDIDGIDVGAAKTFDDCNHNGIDDLCDIARGFSANDNDIEPPANIPDECETACSVTSEAPEPERLPLIGGPISQKIRYISFTASGTGQRQAIRVTFEDLLAPFHVFNGEVMWVGEPKTYCENSGQSKPPDDGCGPAPGLPSRTFMAAKLTCDPDFTDWHGVCRCGWCIGGFNDGQTCSNDHDCASTIHVYHELIIPSSIYRIDVIDERCLDLGNELSYSGPMNMDPLETTTSTWGDLVRNCITDPCWPPDEEVNMASDVTAVLDKFRNLDGAPTKARADLDWETPNQRIDMSDVTFVLDAFRGFDYPFPAPDLPLCDDGASD